MNITVFADGLLLNSVLLGYGMMRDNIVSLSNTTRIQQNHGAYLYFGTINIENEVIIGDFLNKWNISDVVKNDVDNIYSNGASKVCMVIN